MYRILTIIFIFCAASACTTPIKYNVKLQQNAYQLNHELVLERKINQGSIESLIPIPSSNELLANTNLGSEFINDQGKVTSVYNQQSGDLDTYKSTRLLAHKIVGDQLILSYQNQVATLGLPNNELVTKLEKPENSKPAISAAISPNGHYALAFGYLWDLNTQQKLDFFKPDDLIFNQSINAEFSPDNRYLVITLNLVSETKVQLWDLQANKLQKTWTLGGLAYVMFSPNSKTMLFNIYKRDYSNISQPQLVIYDVATQSETGTIKFSSDLATDPVIIDDEHIVTAHTNGDIHVWSYQKFNADHSFRGDSAALTMVKDANGRVWCGLDNKKLLVIHNGQFSLVHTFKTDIRHIAVLNNKLAVETFDQNVPPIRFYDIQPLQPH